MSLDKMSEIYCQQLHALYPKIDKTLIQQEVELESLMRAEGIMRYENLVTKAKESGTESNTGYGRLLLRDKVAELGDAITVLMEGVNSGIAGYGRSNLRLIRTLDCRVIAYIALKTLIDNIATKSTLQFIAIAIANVLEDEVRYQRFAEIAQKDYSYALKRVSKSTTYHRKRAGINTIMTHKATGAYNNEPVPELVWEAWKTEDKMGIGVKLVNTVIGITGVAEVRMVKASKGAQPQYHLFPTEEFIKWARNNTDRNALLSPVTLPTVIPPKDYTTVDDGGYHTPFIPKKRIIKTNDPEHIQTLRNSVDAMQPVYQAVNAAQQTPWRINKKVLDVLTQFWTNSITLGVLPAQEDEELPRCHVCGQIPVIDKKTQFHSCFLADEHTLKAWKKQAIFTHERNAKNVSKRLQIHRILWAADKMKNYNAIYFSYQLDFRGRIYAVAQFLNPQGCDVAKGLLEFSEAKPITDEKAANWLAIHTANTWGEDKKSFAERIQWVKDNQEMIVAIAADPMENREWTKADSPWCFLASCFEWANFVKEGYGYLSRIAIAQDGTCSGLQHYSAILRDEIGGRAVNLVPSDRPQDIYAVVAMRVLGTLTNTFPDDDDYHLAQQWIQSGLVTRKLTKRSVMTLPYGSTLYSAKNDVREHVEEMREKTPNAIPWSPEETQQACNYIAQLIWAAIKQTVIAASSAMDWLHKVAALMVKAGYPLTWTTPTGIPVLQTYTDAKTRRINTAISGSLYIRTTKEQAVIESGEGKHVIKLTLREKTDQIDKSRQIAGLAPNFIDSLDASSRVMAVRKSHAEGINSFALIHDSFGTHAAESERLACALRETFVQMYTEHDVLKELRDTIYHRLPEDLKDELPELPPTGRLNLAEVINSPYFFA